jgi:uncharacterized protein YegL
MGNSLDQRPFQFSTFADNPENRCPVVLLLDTSGSMGGDPIRALNAGLTALKADLLADPMAVKRVEIAMVTFGPIQIEAQFDSVDNLMLTELRAGGDTPMGGAIETAIRLLDERKADYKRADIQYYRPWIFLITDGGPTDEWRNAAALVRAGEAKKSFMFFAVGVDRANMDVLAQISVRAPLKLDGLRFADLFAWLSSSIQAQSHSNLGEPVALVNPQGPNGWATIE